MNVFLIEDDTYILQELKLLLEKKKEINIVGACKSVKCSLEVLPLLNVDLVLMDIQLEDGKSFEIIEKLNKINFDIIFITAHDEFAIKAIKIGAIDYLLKPINEDELVNAIDIYKKKKYHSLAEEQKKLMLRHYEDNVPVKKITVRTLNEIFFIDVSQIIYCKSEGNYTTFHIELGKTITSSKPLREYVSILSSPKFLKTHQSYLINTDFVDFYRNSYEVIMKDGTTVPVSVRHKEDVIQKLSCI